MVIVLFDKLETVEVKKRTIWTTFIHTSSLTKYKIKVIPWVMALNDVLT